ncbi:SRPBCC domain-containing protein [Patescibacteria group bacterium]|nr:SRPBCC domain-containing protein [Patescibacteria group bacterium]
MHKLHFSTFIQASPAHVWDVMLSDVTYRQWTNVFMPGSYYKGSWDKGSKILFLAPAADGRKEGGMVSRIAESRPHEFVSIEHLGMISDGVEDTESELVKKWAGAHENYTFETEGTGTRLTIDVDTSEDEAEFMEKAWKNGLEVLKTLAEA